MKAKSETTRARSNRNFARSALKLIFTVLYDILFPEVLVALLKAKGSYLSRLGNEGRRALRALNHVGVEDVRKGLREVGRKVLRETRDRGCSGLPRHTASQGQGMVE